MPSTPKLFLHLTPRILGILLALFVSVFALDVFGMRFGPWETFLALLIHLVPTAAILLALAIAWRWPLAGGILFLGLGTLYIVMALGKFPWSVIALLSGVPYLLGVLFFWDWWTKAELKLRP